MGLSARGVNLQLTLQWYESVAEKLFLTKKVRTRHLSWREDHLIRGVHNEGHHRRNLSWREDHLIPFARKNVVQNKLHTTLNHRQKSIRFMDKEKYEIMVMSADVGSGDSCSPFC